MAITIRRATDADHDALVVTDARSFGFTPTPDDITGRRGVLDMDRFFIAVEGTEVVGVTGSFGLDVTVPGGSSLPMGGVTYVGVSATHRRQGLLRRLMAACHDDIRARDEPLAGLGASEAGIYERFGYGQATMCWSTVIDRRRAVLRPEFEPRRGAVRFVEGDAAADHVAKLWERYRGTRAGEVDRWPAWQQRLRDQRSKAQGGFSPAWYLAHDAGYAAYRIEQHWNEGHPAHVLEVVELVAVTADAHLDLWATIFGVDLVGPIRSRALPPDDALPYLLADPRALRTEGLTDWLWVAPFDVVACLAGRTYDVPDRLVVEVDGARVAVEGGPEGATARRVRTRSDLVCTRAALGGLLLGGVTVSTLIAGRRATARNAEAERRANAFFRTARAPHSQSMF